MCYDFKMASYETLRIPRPRFLRQNLHTFPFADHDDPPTPLRKNKRGRKTSDFTAAPNSPLPCIFQCSSLLLACRLAFFGTWLDGGQNQRGIPAERKMHSHSEMGFPYRGKTILILYKKCSFFTIV